MLSIIELLAVEWFVCAFLMVLVWMLAARINNYSIVDIAWSFSFSVAVLISFIFSSGDMLRKWAVLFTVMLWSIRLFTFLLKRIYRHHPSEDARYQDFRNQYGKSYKRGFFWFFQIQALSVVLLSVPFILVMRNIKPELHLIEWAGMCLVIGGVIGEALSDRQKEIFKKVPGNKNKNCEIGLWSYSRHPNYFFESVVWIGFAVMALASPYGWVSLYCPAVMLWLLLKVTGVPLAERNGLRQHGEVYRAYQKRTSAFVPWFHASLIVFMLLAGTQDTYAESAPLPDRVAYLYPLNSKDAKPVFIQKTHYSKDNEGRIHQETVITDAEGKTALKETALYLGTQLISQEVDQIQNGEHFTVNVKDKKVYFTVLHDGKTKKDDLKWTSDFITGPVVEAFFADHWDELIRGETVKSRFGVLESLDTYGFKFKIKRKEKFKDRDVVVLSMKPTSFVNNMLFSMLGGDIEIYLDPQTKRYVRYLGPTPLQHKDENGRPHRFVSEIIYQ